MPTTRWLRIVSLVALVAGTSCARPATQLLVVLDSDAPPERTLRITAVATQGTQTDTHEFNFGQGAPMRLPASFGVASSSAPSTDVVTLQFTVDSPATTTRDGTMLPAARFVITRRPTLLANHTQQVPVFINMRCGLVMQSGCPEGRASCTTADVCTARGQTCGDNGECVDPNDVVVTTLPPGFVRGSEIDATSRPDSTVTSDAPADRIDAGITLDSSPDTSPDTSLDAAMDSVVDAPSSPYLQLQVLVLRGTSGFDPPAAIGTRVLGSANGQQLVIRVTGTPNTPFKLGAMYADGRVIRDPEAPSNAISTNAAGSYDSRDFITGTIADPSGIYRARWWFYAAPGVQLRGPAEYNVDFDACVRHAWTLLPDRRVQLTTNTRNAGVRVRLGFAGGIYPGSIVPASGCDGATYNPIISENTPVALTHGPVAAGFTGCAMLSLMDPSSHVVCGPSAIRLDAP